ncbi:MAG: PTS sugar transporter subunit IIA [Lentisphaeria bacterium]|nr:MAG: PTS sugar transporter subunit IIA [Lentisphaeria bacterium]
MVLRILTVRFDYRGFSPPNERLSSTSPTNGAFSIPLIELLAKTPQITSKAELADGIFRREALMSTGIGLGIAIPHVRLASVTGMVMAAALVPDGISDYESLDNQPVRLVAMIAARLDQHAEYLQLLSCLSSELKADVFRAGLFRCTNASELFRELISQDR